MSFESYFIQYKFIIPEALKHSSYTYQKLFRALYGYTQSVHKSSGRNYSYHRKGVLSDVPYIRPGKNCVIIPKDSLTSLIDFFKTGKNPTHKWEVKGDWKAVYYMDEKDLDPQTAVLSIENLLERKFVKKYDGGYGLLHKTISEVTDFDENTQIEEPYKNYILNEAKNIVSLDWFKKSCPSSDKLNAFQEKYLKLRNSAYQ